MYTVPHNPLEYTVIFISGSQRRPTRNCQTHRNGHTSQPGVLRPLADLCFPATKSCSSSDRRTEHQPYPVFHVSTVASEVQVIIVLSECVVGRNCTRCRPPAPIAVSSPTTDLKFVLSLIVHRDLADKYDLSCVFYLLFIKTND